MELKFQLRFPCTVKWKFYLNNHWVVPLTLISLAYYDLVRVNLACTSQARRLRSVLILLNVKGDALARVTVHGDNAQQCTIA